MRGLRTKTRAGWVEQVLGKNRSLTVRNMVRALQRRRAQGWVTAMGEDGAAYEQVVMVRAAHPMAEIIRQYVQGARWFERVLIENLLGAPIDTTGGARRLAKVGLAAVASDGTQIQLVAADPREALYVNEARCRPPVRGVSARRLAEAILHLRRPGTRRINLSDDRRLAACETLQNKWQIQCEDLLDERRRVRLFSNWTFQHSAA